MSSLWFLLASFGLWRSHYALKPEPHKVFSALEMEKTLNCDGKGRKTWKLVQKVLQSQPQFTVLGWSWGLSKVLIQLQFLWIQKNKALLTRRRKYSQKNHPKPKNWNTLCFNKATLWPYLSTKPHLICLNHHTKTFTIHRVFLFRSIYFVLLKQILKQEISRLWLAPHAHFKDTASNLPVSAEAFIGPLLFTVILLLLDFWEKLWISKPVQEKREAWIFSIPPFYSFSLFKEVFKSP